jgi:hypothetical protein
MRVSIIDWGDIEDIIPNIEGNDCYSISVIFNDGTTMVYGYTDRDGFRYDYKYLIDAWGNFGRMK